MKTTDWIKINKPVFSWKVPSKSMSNTFHSVGWYADGHWECDCTAYQMSNKPKNCKHIDLVKLKFKPDENRISRIQYSTTISKK